MGTCDRQEKVSSSPKVLLGNCLQIRNLFWRYTELNRLWVGSSEIPILWELHQDDRTVCCGHTIVDSYVMQCLVFSCNVECCTLTAMTIFNKFKAHTELVNKKYSFSWEYFFANYGQTQHHTSWQYRVVPKQREDWSSWTPFIVKCS